MQKITQLMRDAFIDGTPFRRDNTEVVVNEFGVSIYLFGNKIAFRSDELTRAHRESRRKGKDTFRG